MNPQRSTTALDRDAAPTVDGGRHLWRSLEELADDDQFAAALAREFPEYADRMHDATTRREFLQLMGASLALAGAAGCVQQPAEGIVPYVRAPEDIIPGKPLYYATAITHDGAASGLLVESQTGRPVKVEGNPRQPAVPEIMRSANDAAGGVQLRFGATDAYSQAAVLSLYDPDRSQTVLHYGQIETWESFAAEWSSRMAAFLADGGRGLRLLTQTVVSPTLADQLRQLSEKFPNAQWHQYEPLHNDAAVVGSQWAFGRVVEPIYRLAAADVILALDADFLVDGPWHLQNAAAFARRRKLAPGDGSATLNRLYVVESGRSLTGASADHRLPLAPSAIAALALELAETLGAQLGDAAANPAGAMAPANRAWLDAVTADLKDARGRSLVVAGRSQPPVVHALAHWINETLGNVGQTVDYYPPLAARPVDQLASLQDLVAAMRAGEVQSLVILGGNPVFDAPADLRFVEALAKVPHSVHLSQYNDETSAHCAWHLPEAHLLESWSDTRAADGTASIVQPLIEPLFRGKTVHEVVAALLGNPQPVALDLVRDYWKSQLGQTGGGSNFQQQWQRALHDGIVAGTSASPLSVRVSANWATAAAPQIAAAAVPSNDQLQVVYRPAPALWDGRFANNGWLQELPQPFTKLTWDNAALVSPETAAAHALASGDVVEIAVGDPRVEIPVFVVPGHPVETVTLQVGYGRTTSGRIGDGVGVDVYPLRKSDAMWAASASLRKTGRTHLLATTQHHHLMEGRHLVRTGTLAELAADPAHPEFMRVGHQAPPPEVTMYPPHPYEGYKWGLAVDLSKCTGCSACVVACQAENNVPIVGKDQVSRGREMHWLRIDQYYSGETANPASYHQPVMCQHCELAPCEVVCPVGATTHSDEGLNEMTYNRCVGTRYCSNNCPYKVRRFNFLEYNAELKSDPLLQLRSNPNVTVRSRGVMEKCTYCVQRINAARIESENHDRPIRDGQIVTACQAACPSEALVFGNLNDPGSAVAQLAASSLNYALLGELNTRPRTTYLARVTNPNPQLAADDSPAPMDTTQHGE
jgi:MoCo/4Fe-4S cofactor protein with predicted Tat translocation signal